MKSLIFILEGIPLEWTGKNFDKEKLLKWIQKKWNEEEKEFVCLLPAGVGISGDVLFKKYK